MELMYENKIKITKNNTNKLAIFLYKFKTGKTSNGLNKAYNFDILINVQLFFTNIVKTSYEK